MYMLYDRVMTNIQNRHKRIKQMNSFINAWFQRKLRKFAKNPLSGCRLSGPGSLVWPLSWVLSLESCVPSLWSRVSCPGSYLWVGSRVAGLGSHFSNMTFSLEKMYLDHLSFIILRRSCYSIWSLLWDLM